MASEIDERLSKELGEIIQKLSLGIQLYVTYPAGHPHPLKMLEQCTEILNNWIKRNGEFVIVVFEGKFVINNIKFDSDKNPILGSFVRRLQKRKVESLSFRFGLTLEHLQFFATMLSRGDKRDLDEILKEKGIPEIAINQVKFGILGKEGPQTRGLTTVDYTQFKEEELDEEEGSNFEKQVVFAFKNLAKNMMGLHSQDQWGEMTKKIAQIALGLNPSLRDRIMEESELSPEIVQSINEALMRGEGDKQTDDDIIKAFESMTGVLFRLKGGSDWQSYAKQIVQIAAGLEPNVYKKVMENYSEDSSLGNIFRMAVKNMNDDELIEMVVSRYRDVKEIHASDEDKKDILTNFIASVEQADSNRIAKLSKIIEGRLKEEHLSEDIGVRILEEITKDDRVVVLKESTFSRLQQSRSAEDSQLDAAFEKMILVLDNKLDDTNIATRLKVIKFIMAHMDSYFEHNLSLDLAQLLTKHLKTEKNINILKGLLSCLGTEAGIAKEHGQKEVLLHIKRELEYQLKPYSLLLIPAKRRVLEILVDIWGIESLESFIEAFGHDDLKDDVKQVLIGVGLPAIPKILELLMEEPDPARAEVLGEVLISFSDELIPPLSRSLPQAGTAAKIRILNLLGKVATEDEFTLIQPVLKDRSDQVRIVALKSLANLPGPKEGIEEELLNLALKDLVLAVRLQAIENLSKWGGEKTLNALSPYITTKDIQGRLKEERLTEVDYEQIKNTIIRTFGKMHSVEALKLFEEKLRERRLFNKQPLINTKFAILDALTHYSLPEIKPLLEIAVNKGEKEIKAKAQNILSGWQEKS
jgi:hypothetical protein